MPKPHRSQKTPKKLSRPHWQTVTSIRSSGVLVVRQPETGWYDLQKTIQPKR